MTKNSKATSDAPTLGDKIIDIILKPGEWICQAFKMKESEQRHFLRLYLNIFIYTKIAVFGAVYLAIHN